MGDQYYHVWPAQDFWGVALSWLLPWLLLSFFNTWFIAGSLSSPRGTFPALLIIYLASPASLPPSWPISFPLVSHFLLSLFKQSLLKLNMPTQIPYCSIPPFSIWPTAQFFFSALKPTNGGYLIITLNGHAWLHLLKSSPFFILSNFPFMSGACFNTPTLLQWQVPLRIHSDLNYPEV